jgi:flagellum-specific ATP synthase
MTDHAAVMLIRSTDPVARVGRLCRIMPTWLEAFGPGVPIGTLCGIERMSDAADPQFLSAEVVRVDHDRITLVPYGDVTCVAVGARVVAMSGNARLPVGMAFLGRAIDALGAPIDGGAPIVPDRFVALNPDPPAALDRETPDEILETGIRTLDGFLTLGKGQRVGIFAASGVGKTSLLSQLLRQVRADICVACLVGERGLEVEAIWSKELGGAARSRSVVVAATSDAAAALRVRAVHQAVALARYWRDQGLNVFFILDSVTRFAMALREMGLAAGEPPTLRAYTPSVFSMIPRVVEQFGALKQGGSISAVMTVLSETDDVDDPLSELMKSLLDGHILLSRPLAESGHFPAIDPLKSVSRTVPTLRTSAHRKLSQTALGLIARHESARPLIDAGLYTAGATAEIDVAIAARPALDLFMQQRDDEHADFDAMLAQLSIAVGG